MKTSSNIKQTAALLSTVALLALPGHAAQNFSKTHAFSTSNYSSSSTQFGIKATLTASDSYLVPTATKLGNYGVSATGKVLGKVLKNEFTAVETTGTAKVASNGLATFSGNLKVLGTTIASASAANVDLRTYVSPTFVKREYNKSAKYSLVLDFGIARVPIADIQGKIKASIETRFRTDAVITPSLGALPTVALKIGPEARLAATAEASGGLGVDGVASIRVGTEGSLRLGNAALIADATVQPLFTLVPSPVTGGMPTIKPGAKVGVTLTAVTSDLNGTLDIFVEGTLGPISARATKRIADFSFGTTSRTLLGPVTYSWF